MHMGRTLSGKDVNVNGIISVALCKQVYLTVLPWEARSSAGFLSAF